MSRQCKQVPIVIDQFVNTFFGGWTDEAGDFERRMEKTVRFGDPDNGFHDVTIAGLEVILPDRIAYTRKLKAGKWIVRNVSVWHKHLGNGMQWISFFRERASCLPEQGRPG